MRALIVIPTFNERENLATLLGMLLKHPDYRVLVVDDNSPDGTGDVADAFGVESQGRVRCLHRVGKRGLGVAYVAGFMEAVASDCDVVCQMDADLSHDPADVARLIERACDHDLVLGSRYVGGSGVLDWPWHRALLSRFANVYARRRVGLTQRDCTSGFRCWRRDALARIELRRIVSRGYTFQVEMLFAAVRAGFRIVEVPTSFRDRTRGASKMTAAVLLESALMPWLVASKP